MRAMGGRPVLMQRFPHGAGGQSFFQKRVPDNAPEWLETTIVSTVNGTPSRALVVADLAHVAWAVNLGCLGFHVWPFARRRSRVRRRAAPRPRPAARHRLRRGARRRVRAQGAARRARDRRLPEDDRQPRASTSTSGSSRAGTPIEVRSAAVAARARARAPPARPPHRRLVEGGARRADLRRLQPERAAQDRVRRVVGARPRRARRCRPRSRWDELDDDRSRRADDRDGAGAARARRRSVGRRSTTPRSRSSRCSRLHRRDRENGLKDAPWPPVYPKKPDEPPRVAPSRARKPDEAATSTGRRRPEARCR